MRIKKGDKGDDKGVVGLVPAPLRAWPLGKRNPSMPRIESVTGSQENPITARHGNCPFSEPSKHRNCKTTGATVGSGRKDRRPVSYSWPQKEEKNRPAHQRNPEEFPEEDWPQQKKSSYR